MEPYRWSLVEKAPISFTHAHLGHDLHVPGLDDGHVGCRFSGPVRPGLVCAALEQRVDELAGGLHAVDVVAVDGQVERSLLADRVLEIYR